MLSFRWTIRKARLFVIEDHLALHVTRILNVMTCSCRFYDPKSESVFHLFYPRIDLYRPSRVVVLILIPIEVDYRSVLATETQFGCFEHVAALSSRICYSAHIHRPIRFCMLSLPVVAMFLTARGQQDSEYRDKNQDSLHSLFLLV